MAYERYMVEFTRNWSPYQARERAAFPERKAQDLVDRGVAKMVSDKPLVSRSANHNPNNRDAETVAVKKGTTSKEAVERRKVAKRATNQKK